MMKMNAMPIQRECQPRSRAAFLAASAFCEAFIGGCKGTPSLAPKWHKAGQLIKVNFRLMNRLCKAQQLP
jgi:hypothetical protein